ncbi:MAG TPA: DUF4157 domain-containing protein [Kofleriaceae bacterium]|nr:DUF4157 domain-containing protein [Kofleriaceae bacterium]
MKRFRFERDAEEDRLELDDADDVEADRRRLSAGQQSRSSQVASRPDDAVGPRPSWLSPGKRATSARIPPARRQAALQHRRARAPSFDEKKELEIAARGLSDLGGPLPYIEELQRAFGRHDVTDIRAATGSEADRANERMGSVAYAMGDAVVFRDSSPDLFTVAHEAAHVIQQRGGAVATGTVGQSGDRHEVHADAVAERVVRGESAEDLLDQVAPVGSRNAAPSGPVSVQRFDDKDYEGLTPTQAVRKALDDDEANDAITLMLRLGGAGDANVVLNSCQSLATSCFGNSEMAEAARILVGLGGSLGRALEWMYDEGTDWSSVAGTIRSASAAQKATLKTDGWRDHFVSELGNDEVAELVDLLGLELKDKLEWMSAEGTDWSAVRGKIVMAPAEQRAALVTSGWRDWFVDLVDNEEMSDVVDLLGMKLETKLEWLFAEGTDDSIVEGKISAAPAAERTALVTDAWRDRFVEEFDNQSMSRLVDLLDMPLAKKLEWMYAEGTDDELILAKIRAATPEDRATVTTDAWRDRFVEEFGNETMSTLVDLLGMPLSKKLEWMYAEGTDDQLILGKIRAATPADRATVTTDAWRDRFVEEFDNETMSTLVDLLAMPLARKLDWMRAEGSDYDAIIGKIRAAPADERVALYDSDLRDFFVSECDDQEMAEVVTLLGGTLVQQLSWMAAEGSSPELVLARVNAAPAADRPGIHANGAVCEMIRDFVPVGRAPIIQAVGGTPEQQMDLFGDDSAIRLLTWATPSADWVNAIMKVRTDPLDLFEVAKGNPAGWGSSIQPRLWDLLKGYEGTLHPEDRVAVFWAAYGTGSTFSADQILHFFKVVYGRGIQPASEDITISTGLLTRRRYSVVAPTTATAQALMDCIKPGGGGPSGIGRAEVAIGIIAFCTHKHDEELGLSGWTTTKSEILGTSYFDDPYVIIRAVGPDPTLLGVQPGVLDNNPIGSLGGTPTAVGTGLNFFQNHVRHEIGHAVGSRAIGSMSRSGNDFAQAYGGWQASSQAEFLGAMWGGQAQPATGWPSLAIGTGSVTVTDTDVRDWCIGVISSGAEPANALGSAPGTFAQKKAALAASIWSGERMVAYLGSIPAGGVGGVPGSAYMFPGFAPTSPVQIFSTRWGNQFAKYSTEAYNALTGISWYALSSPVEMFAEMYTARYGGGAVPPATSGGDPNAFFTELEGQRDPMFGEPPAPEPAGPI